MDYSKEQLQRYSRNILVPEIGRAGQEKLTASRVLIIGAGGLGSASAYYLAAAGVGTLGLADGDKPDLTNLQRQILHHTGDLGVPKTVSAADKLSALNPGVHLVTYPERLDNDSLRELLSDYDFVIDATDNFESKFMINDVCASVKKPFSHCGVVGLTGQTMTVLPDRSACYRCLFGAPPPEDAVPTSATAGILGAVAGTLGTIQATEAIKFLADIGDLLTDRLLVYHAKSMAFRTVPLTRNPECGACGNS